MIEVVRVGGQRIQVPGEHARISVKCPKCRRLVGSLRSGDAAMPLTESLAAGMGGPGEVWQALRELAGPVERLVGLARGIRLFLGGVLGVLLLVLIRLCVLR